MTRVWEHSRAEGTNLLVLLALADFADENDIAWPSKARIAERCRISPRTVIRRIKTLEAQGELEPAGTRGRARTRAWKITPGAQPGAPAKEPPTRGSSRRDPAPGGDNLTPLAGPGGDTAMTPRGVTQLRHPGGDTAVSPDPSVNQQQEPLLPSGGGAAGAAENGTGSWSKRACDIWIAVFAGTAPGGRIGTALKPLVAQHGADDVLSTFERWLRKMNTQGRAAFATPEAFAQKYGTWKSGATTNGGTTHGTSREGGRAIDRTVAKRYD